MLTLHKNLIAAIEAILNGNLNLDDPVDFPERDLIITLGSGKNIPQQDYANLVWIAVAKKSPAETTTQPDKDYYRVVWDHNTRQVKTINTRDYRPILHHSYTTRLFESIQQAADWRKERTLHAPQKTEEETDPNQT